MNSADAFPNVLKQPIEQLIHTLPITLQLTLDYDGALEYSNNRYSIYFWCTGTILTTAIHDSLAAMGLNIDEQEAYLKASHDLAAPDSIEQLTNFLRDTIERQEDWNAS